jgi:hypothetical protein
MPYRKSLALKEMCANAPFWFRCEVLLDDGLFVSFAFPIVGIIFIIRRCSRRQKLPVEGECARVKTFSRRWFGLREWKVGLELLLAFRRRVLDAEQVCFDLGAISEAADGTVGSGDSVAWHD